MSRTTEHVDATPERIFRILDDPWTYEFWVVGCKNIRAADPEWPAVGASFHHSVGIGPITVKDKTTILERDPPRRLKLRARARPTGIAHVDVQLTPSGSGTNVVMLEEPVEGPAAKLHNPLLDRLIHHRNVETLRRLKWLAERESI
jgi:carbon monoxide dehydrogenase subunit G